MLRKSNFVLCRYILAMGAQGMAHCCDLYCLSFIRYRLQCAVATWGKPKKKSLTESACVLNLCNAVPINYV